MFPRGRKIGAKLPTDFTVVIVIFQRKLLNGKPYYTIYSFYEISDQADHCGAVRLHARYSS